MCNHFYSSTFRILHLVNLYAHWPFLPSPLPGSLLSVFCFCDFDCSEVIKYSSVCVWVCERETTLFHIALISLELTHVELYVMISFLFEGESYSNACVDQFYFSVHPLMSTWLALFFFFWLLCTWVYRKALQDCVSSSLGWILRIGMAGLYGHY